MSSTAHWTPEEYESFQGATTGQLTIQSVEGRVLASVLAGAEPKAIVEIGTWNGLGSTLCILQGLQGAPYESFHSIE